MFAAERLVLTAVLSIIFNAVLTSFCNRKQTQPKKEGSEDTDNKCAAKTPPGAGITGKSIIPIKSDSYSCSTAVVPKTVSRRLHLSKTG